MMAAVKEEPRSEVIDTIVSLFSGYAGTERVKKNSPKKKQDPLQPRPDHELEESRRRQQQQQDELSRLAAENEKLRAIVDSTSAKLQSTIEVLQLKAGEHHAFASEQANLIADLEDRLASRTDQLRHLDSELAGLRRELAESRELNADANGRIAELRDELSYARKRADAAGSSADDAEKARMDAEAALREAADARSQLQKLQSAYKTMAAEKDLLLREVQALRSKAESNAEADQLRRELQRIRDAGRGMDDKLARAIMELQNERVRSGKVEADLQSTIARLRSEVAHEHDRVNIVSNELNTAIAHLQADKARLAELLRAGKLVDAQDYIGDQPAPGSFQQQHWLGSAPTPIDHQQQHDGQGDDAGGDDGPIDWFDGANWVPAIAIDAAATLKRKYDGPVAVKDLHHFLLTCNRAWHEKLVEGLKAKDRECRKRLAWRAPYQEVLQTATIARLRTTLSTLQAIASGRQPPAQGFGATTIDTLTEPTPGEVAFGRSMRNGGDGMAATGTMRSVSASRSGAGGGTAAGARLLSVPGSGGRRLDGYESAQLLNQAMECVDFLQKKIGQLEKATNEAHIAAASNMAPPSVMRTSSAGASATAGGGRTRAASASRNGSSSDEALRASGVTRSAAAPPPVPASRFASPTRILGFDSPGRNTAIKATAAALSSSGSSPMHMRASYDAAASSSSQHPGLTVADLSASAAPGSMSFAGASPARARPATAGHHLHRPSAHGYDTVMPSSSAASLEQRQQGFGHVYGGSMASASSASMEGSYNSGIRDAIAAAQSPPRYTVQPASPARPTW